MSVRLSVPGNLLLAGEYALLEEGGLGVALAVEPRLTVTVFPAEEWELIGLWPGTTERWVPGQPATFASKLFEACLDALMQRGDERERKWDRAIPPARLELDSSALFDAQGRKRGFGSSAALAVGIAAALAHQQRREDSASVHQIAVAAHRVAQGGAGSGYDVTASFFGGLGRFTGGVFPQWEPLDARVLPSMAVFPGPQAVKTTRSIDLYRAWQATQPTSAGQFVERSNAAVAALAKARSTEALLSAWEDCREVGLAVGSAIGSNAQLPPFETPLEGLFVKALGAGNETGLSAGAAEAFLRPLPETWEPLTLAPLGLRWE
jgi:phosphomevalonate kinase